MCPEAINPCAMWWTEGEGGGDQQSCSALIPPPPCHWGVTRAIPGDVLAVTTVNDVIVIVIVIWEGGCCQAPLLFLLDDCVVLVVLVVNIDIVVEGSNAITAPLPSTCASMERARHWKMAPSLTATMDRGGEDPVSSCPYCPNDDDHGPTPGCSSSNGNNAMMMFLFALPPRGKTMLSKEEYSSLLLLLPTLPNDRVFYYCAALRSVY
jgi:hypothetical protein